MATDLAIALGFPAAGFLLAVLIHRRDHKLYVEEGLADLEEYLNDA